MILVIFGIFIYGIYKGTVAKTEYELVKMLFWYIILIISLIILIIMS